MVWNAKMLYKMDPVADEWLPAPGTINPLHKHPDWGALQWCPPLPGGAGLPAEHSEPRR